MFKFRAKRKNSTQWVHGFYAHKKLMNKHYILQEEVKPYCAQTVLTEIEVDPTTVGQLRHVNHHGEYYDGDVYYHAGYGFETVSAISEIQFSLGHGTSDDIGEIKGNIHDNPNVFLSEIINNKSDFPHLKSQFRQCLHCLHRPQNKTLCHLHVNISGKKFPKKNTIKILL